MISIEKDSDFSECPKHNKQSKIICKTMLRRKVIHFNLNLQRDVSTKHKENYIKAISIHNTQTKIPKLEIVYIRQERL